MTTRWTDTETNTLEGALEIIKKPVSDDNSIINWNISIGYDNNQLMQVGGKNITYNVAKLTYDQITSDDPDTPLEERVRTNSALIIPYFNGSSVNYIINKNSNAQTILRKLLNYTGRGEIVKNIFDEIDSNFFIWVINRVYSSNFVVETGNEQFGDINIDAIKEFKGDTEDLLTKVSARGESVMNLISTLSFLLESNKLNQIKLDISSSDHLKIEIHLNKIGTIATNDQRYLGAYADLDRDLRKAKMYLLIYLEIMPALLQSKRDDDWKRESHIEFMRTVAEDLTNKINEKVKLLGG